MFLSKENSSQQCRINDNLPTTFQREAATCWVSGAAIQNRVSVFLKEERRFFNRKYGGFLPLWDDYLTGFLNKY